MFPDRNLLPVYLLKHGTAVDRGFRNLLQDIPVLDDLIVLYPEYVHNCYTVISLLPEKVTMNYDEICISNESFEIESE